jgi:glycosyltransferase involved in cell wall biosynthesis
MEEITVGMTAYNSADFIEESIKNLLSQSEKNFKLIISDDASTDDTEIICKKLMTFDTRIEYYRQKINLGPKANFEFVFNKCETEFFMWASHDDLWSKFFIEKSILELKKNPDSGFVITKWIVESRKIPFLRRYFLPDMSFVTNHDPIKRMISYTSLPFVSFKDNITYGVWRQKALKDVISKTREIKYFSIGGAANEYTLLLNRGCYLKSVFLRKRYIYAPPGSFIFSYLEILRRMMWWKPKITNLNPKYTEQDHIEDLLLIFNIVGLDKDIITDAIKLNKIHLKIK